MRVDIWSDLVCPWCYLGKRRFDKALATLSPDASVEVVHRSFQLDSSLPIGQSLPVRDMLMRKYRMTEGEVVASQEGAATAVFADIGALAWYLSNVPWAVPDFSIDRYRPQLLRLHGEPIRVPAERFWIAAVPR